MGDRPAELTDRLVSADPAKNWFGIAWWWRSPRTTRDGWELERAGLVLAKDLRDHLLRFPIGHVAVERMLSADGWTKNPNDIIAVSEASGRLVGFAEAFYGAGATWRTGPGWKGQLPKSVCHDYCRAALSSDELARVHLPKNKQRQLDVWDAVGIGLVHVGRAPWRK